MADLLPKQGGGAGGRVDRGGGKGRGPRRGNDDHVDELNSQGNDQGMGANKGVKGVNGNVEGVGNQGNVGNQNGNVVNENVQENVGNVLVNGNRIGCSYKEFLACSPKKYDGKGGVVVLTRWIEKMKFVQDMSGCSIDQKVKYTTGLLMGKALMWWNSQIRTLSQEVAVSISWNDFKFMMIEEFYPSHEMQKLVPYLVTPESRKIKRNRSIKKVKKRGNMGEHSKDKNGRNDNKRTKTGNDFATTADPIGRENIGPGGNFPNQVVANNGGQGRRNQGNQARGRAFMLGAEEAHKNPNIVTGTFTLNKHFATTLFDSGADYSFVSTTFTPLLGIEPSELGFRYEIEIASGQLIEIDKVIKGCKLEIEGHAFDIDLILFGHGSFDVIIAKPPYRLAPSELEDLSEQLKELQDKVAATDDSPAIPEHTTVETPMNMSPENKAHFQAEKEAIHLILTGIRDEIYLTVNACQIAQEMWEAIERLKQELSRFVTIVKQQHKLDEVSYYKLFDILKQYQKEVNELYAERLARNANPLALVATAQANQDPYYQISKSHKSHAPSSKPSILTRSHTTTRHKGKEIAKPITPPSKTASEQDSNPEQAQRDKGMQKNLALIAKTVNVAGARENVGSPVVQKSGIQCFNCKEFGHFAKECRKSKRVKDSVCHKEKMLLCKQAEQGVLLQAKQYDWLADTDEEVDEQEMEAHYSYMAKIQEVPTADTGTDSEPLEPVQNDAGYNVFSNDLQHPEQSESVSNTYLVEVDDSNVIPDSPDMCEDDIQNDQNDVESNDERVALANLKLDVDENK
nr:reverse transcriptase domain-containing protein [Tanacetum cinerariifolium]